MKKEVNILELFPKNFYINKKGEFMAEMSMHNLNIIIDYIYNLKNKINEYEKIQKTAIEYILDHHPDKSILPQGLYKELLCILKR